MIKKKIGLANALFPKVRQQVLGLLYAQPDVDFYTNEIIRLTASGTGAIQRELAKLVAAGLVTVKSIGNQKRYQANQAIPFFAELRSIFLKTVSLADILREALKPLFPKQIAFAFVYGSVARQEDTAKSDIDLLIISDNLTYADLFHLLEKSEVQLGRSINPTIYSPAEWIHKYQEGSNFIAQIIKQPKIFLMGSEDEFAKLR